MDLLYSRPVSLFSWNHKCNIFVIPEVRSICDLEFLEIFRNLITDHAVHSFAACHFFEVEEVLELVFSDEETFLGSSSPDAAAAMMIISTMITTTAISPPLPFCFFLQYGHIFALAGICEPQYLHVLVGPLRAGGGVLC